MGGARRGVAVGRARRRGPHRLRRRALADQGRLPEALALLRKRAEPVEDPEEHHLRLWYALADLEERAGNLARARELFDQVRRVDPPFADVAERLAALG